MDGLAVDDDCIRASSRTIIKYVVDYLQVFNRCTIAESEIKYSIPIQPFSSYFK